MTFDSSDLKSENQNIKILRKRKHSKASEEYVDVIFKYPKNNQTWEGSVPTSYRRTGTFAETDADILEVVEKTYEFMNPDKWEDWGKKQEKFWKEEKKGAHVTKSFFDPLTDFKWHCQNCSLPNNPNWARRVQDLKEFGYTIATDTKKYCNKCNKNNTHLILLPIPRGGVTGYEVIKPQLKKKILKILDFHDAYEDRKVKHLLPDHKFPEIRWDEETKQENPANMSNEEIKHKFQLISNQRNQQKRENCRKCYQSGKRGFPFGIKFFYEGSESWPDQVPKRGKEAEKGCIGCGWYDLEKWRKELNKRLTS